MTAKTLAKTTRCRYLDRQSNQCTGEAVDDFGEALLCSHHISMVMLLLANAGYRITAPRKAA